MIEFTKEMLDISHQYASDNVVSVTTEWDHLKYDSNIFANRIICYLYFKESRKGSYSIYWNVYGSYNYEGRSEFHDKDGMVFWKRKPTIEDAITFLVTQIEEWLNKDD